MGRWLQHPVTDQNQRSLPAFILVACIASGVVLTALYFAQYRLATVFKAWDDEGYMLIAMRNYLAGHHLYSETYTQYGPFHFFAQGLTLRLLHLPVTHDAGRLVAFLDWVLAAALGGAFAYRMSSNLLLSSSAFASCMLVGDVVANEPGHPQQTILPLFMLAVFLCPGAGSRRYRARLWGLGAIGSALLFTKINIGIFYFAALIQVCVTLLPQSRIRNASLGLTIASAAVLPYILMHSTLWAVKYHWFLATLCLLAVFATGVLIRVDSPLSWRPVVWALMGITVAAAAIVAVALWQGVSARLLLHGVVLDPSKHPRVFLVPLDISHGTSAGMLLILACSMMLAWVSFRGGLKRSADITGALVCLAGIVAVGLAPSAVEFGTSRSLYPYALLPLGLIPLAGRDWRALFPQLFLTNLAAMQFLGAYPVAGSQIAISASPMVLWGFTCMINGSSGLLSVLRRRVALSKHDLLRVTAVLILLFVAAGAWREGFRPFRYRWPASNLAGMHSVHLRPDMEASYEFLAASVRANCDLLFTMPGMASFNFWSGVPTPDGSNLTAWVQGMSAAKQQRTLESLEGDPRACVITNTELLRFWQTPTTLTPLALYIDRMPVVAGRGGYEIRVSPERNAAWVH
jgi:hypothetical protein